MLTGPTGHKVRAIEVAPKPISRLLQEMTRTGYQGRRLGQAADTWEAMIKSPDLTIVMGLAGSMSTAGQWRMVNWLIENHLIDVLVSTGANISEDIVDAMGAGFWQGDADADDSALLEADINRYYDVLGREADYRRMEDLLTGALLTLDKDYRYTSAELLYRVGQWLNDHEIPSIAAVAARNGVPVFAPALVDSAFGEAFLMARNLGHQLTLDQVREFEQFVGLAQTKGDVGVVYIGGGVPKDFTQLLAISLSPWSADRPVAGRNAHRRGAIEEYYYPHKYAVQITTDAPQWGGLSGCTLEEAISWGKIKADGQFVTCYCDATIALPLLTHALAERLTNERDGRILTTRLFGAGRQPDRLGASLTG